MLITLKSSILGDTYSQCQTKSARKLYHSFVTVSAASLLMACTNTLHETESVKQDDIEAVAASSEVYVAFAGGGWRAHTGHAAWITALLDNEPAKPQTSLDEAFTNVSGVASNSGGSWFNVMLSYSDAFRKVLEAPNASTSYLTDPKGYYAEEKRLMKHPTNKSSSIVCDASAYILPDLAIACETGLNWHNLVENFVFAPLSMSSDLKDVTLGGQQAWGRPKSISLAATALTQKAVLTSAPLISRELADKYYYDSANLGLLNVAPVTFGAKAVSSDPTPKFFPGGSGTFDITYKDTGIGPWAGKSVAKPGNNRDLDSSGINVINAAAASSAAMGFLNSTAVLENNNVPASWHFAYDAENLALLFNLPNQTGAQKLSRTNIPPAENDYTNMAAGYIKIADGGALDNSGVAHAVLTHQAKYSASTPFEIIAFDNVEEVFPMGPRTNPIRDVGIDIANLFGYGYAQIPNSPNKGMCVGKFCVTTVKGNISPQIFDSNIVAADKGWSWTSRLGGPPACVLIYVPYSVKTVDNSMMGIKSGYSGTLHSFTARCPDAKTAPIYDKDWEAYEDMFNAIQKGMKEKGGLKHLRSAFKLP